jgi:hypothetical protein
VNVTNTSTRGVYVSGQVVQAGDTAKVRDSKDVRELVKAGVLTVEASDKKKKEDTDDAD